MKNVSNSALRARQHKERALWLGIAIKWPHGRRWNWKTECMSIWALVFQLWSATIFRKALKSRCNLKMVCLEWARFPLKAKKMPI